MIGVPFSRSIQRLMKAGMEVLKQIMKCGQARHKDGGQACQDNSYSMKALEYTGTMALRGQRC